MHTVSLNKIDTRSIRVPFPLLVAEKIERWRRYTTVWKLRKIRYFLRSEASWEFLLFCQDDVIPYFTDCDSGSQIIERQILLHLFWKLRMSFISNVNIFFRPEAKAM